MAMPRSSADTASRQGEPLRVDASDVVAGDLIWFLGSAHRVTEIQDHVATNWLVPGETHWRSAHEAATGWCISLFAGEHLEVIR